LENKVINGLDLFSGIGGISLALRDYVKTVAYCEQNKFCQSILLSRMSEGFIDNAPIWDDVKTLRGEMLPEIDIIFGGFPCQDISVAGNGKGLEGERSGLFFEIVRLTKEIRPTFVFLENVPAIRTRGLEQVIKAFTEIRYDCRWTCISAASVGAPHKRERWFLLSHAVADAVKSGYENLFSWGNEKAVARAWSSMDGRKTSNSNSQSKRIRQSEKRIEDLESLWDLESDDWDKNAEFFLRVDNGLSHRAHQIKSLGNSVVQQQVNKAFRILSGI
jgi:DNA (cytosine-5)-methyltransferase 1